MVEILGVKMVNNSFYGGNGTEGSSLSFYPTIDMKHFKWLRIMNAENRLLDKFDKERIKVEKWLERMWSEDG